MSDPAWTGYLFNAAVGAALGAGTNELAIAAILRYILPRKKGELARRIRDVVATDLLSPDKLRRQLEDPRVSLLLRSTIAQALDQALDRDLPSPESLLAEHIPAIDAAAARLRDSLLDELARACGDPAFRDEVIAPFLRERWTLLRERNPASLLSGEMAARAAPAAGAWVEDLQGSSRLKRSLRRTLDAWLADRIGEAGTLADFLSEAAEEGAEELVVAQAPFIVDQLADTVGEEEVRAAIASAVMAAIQERLRGQGLVGNIKGAVASAMRVERDVRAVLEGLPGALRANFTQPENRERLALALRRGVRRVFRRPLGPSFRSAARRDAVVNLFVDRVWRKDVFAELGRRVEKMVAERMEQPLRDTAERLGIAGLSGAGLEEAAERVRRMLLSPATRALLAGQFDEMATAWKARPLGRLGRFVTPETRESIALLAVDEIQDMLRRRVGDFVEQAGMWDIITRSVEEYDDREIAALVGTLARRELRWVTALGGVIGAVVGVLQTLLSAAIGS